MREAVDIRAIRNRSILAGALLAALATVSCGEEPAGEQHPGGNVIFISIDTLRADHLGCYGYPRDTSPELDEFSRGAVLFRKAIAQAPSTVPSHASMFTPDVITLAEIMQQGGYRTISYNGGGQVSATFGFGRGFEVYESVAKDDTFAQKVDAAIEWLDANPGEKFFLFLHTY
ncbi:MAG: sulfatase-like hydrolase/transferase, partial [Planctomycetota bacterium]